MRIAYTPKNPADGDAQVWDFDPGRIRASEAEIIEKRYAGRWENFLADVKGGSIRARRVLLWHLLRTAHHTLKFEDTPDFFADELVCTYSYAELVAMRERVLKANLDADTREQVLTALDIEITEAMSLEGIDEEAALGKAI
jgi:hypothetical protein